MAVGYAAHGAVRTGACGGIGVWSGDLLGRMFGAVFGALARSVATFSPAIGRCGIGVGLSVSIRASGFAETVDRRGGIWCWIRWLGGAIGARGRVEIRGGIVILRGIGTRGGFRIRRGIDLRYRTRTGREIRARSTARARSRVDARSGIRTRSTINIHSGIRARNRIDPHGTIRAGGGVRVRGRGCRIRCG